MVGQLLSAATIAAIRQGRGWSREKLAAEAEVSLATVWRLEHGRYARVEHLVAIADALGVSVDRLLGRAAIEGRPARSRTQGRGHFGA